MAVTRRALAVLALGPALVSPVASAAVAPFPSVGAAPWVSIGKPVALEAHGFPPHAVLAVEADLAAPTVGAHPCCTFSIRKAGRTDANGDAHPLPVARVLHSESWGRGSKWQPYGVAVIWVTAQGDSVPSARTVVFVNG